MIATRTLIAAAAVCAATVIPGFGQDPELRALQQLGESIYKLKDLQDQLKLNGKIAPDMDARKFKYALDAMQSKIAPLDLLSGKIIGPQMELLAQAGAKIRTVRAGSEDRAYDAGSRALDAGRWDEALEHFTQVADRKGDRADGALYWKAYAQNRLGRRDEALATIAALRQQYPSSRWLDDAKALEVEVRAQAGKPVSPDSESNEELKLMAINGLLNSDPDQAIPLLEKLLHSSSSSPRVKDRALFVLTQSKSGRARQVLIDIAKGGTNPDLQLRALRYIGMNNSRDNQLDLVSIYNTSNDVNVKRTILRSFMTSGAPEQLFNVAKNEKNQDLRGEAIRQLGMMGGQTELWQLYQSEASADNKQQILRSMFQSGNGDRLLEIAKSEKDAKLRAEAIRSLGMMGKSDSRADALSAMYGSETDPEVRKQITRALWMSQNAKALVEIARKETNPEMKKDIVQKLSNMHSKEATDYMMELLK
jgi:tetratricopeptide (TPR) repeat protein